MKAYITITLSLISSALLCANEPVKEQIENNELAWVDEQVNAIKPSRDGLKDSTVGHIKNPFIHLAKKQSSKRD